MIDRVDMLEETGKVRLAAVLERTELVAFEEVAVEVLVDDAGLVLNFED